MRELIIFAGGLGSRLKGTETMPKPLVPVNKSAMLSLIIKEYEKTGVFSKYNILISDQQNIYEEWKQTEMTGININIINEGKRTGRTGALQAFIKEVGEEDRNKTYALANGDTIIKSIKRIDIIKCFEHNEKEDIPTVLVMRADRKRKDARDIKMNGTYYSNSGFVVASKSWMERICAENKNIDVDIYIFKKNKFKAITTESQMIDIGTPDRLRDYRRLAQ